MSKTVDNRVVSMEFDNSKFEKNVQTSMNTLNNLNQTIDRLPDTAGKGLSIFSKSAKGMDLSGITSGIDAINSKFSMLGIAGQEVIRDITRSAINFGKNAWNMTFGQITSGGKRRSQNIAQAKFTLEGMGFDFEAYSKDINDAVDGTAYGFDQAAKAASIFASSGVKAGEQMSHALRGISGVAAMTGASYDEIAYVFEKVNGYGKVTGETLNMINGRGLNATAALAKALGKSETDIHKMVQKGQIDFNTFSKAMDDAFGEHAQDADKTLSGVCDNIRATLSRIGQTFYDPLLENDSSLVKMLYSVKMKLRELKEFTDPFAKALATSVLDLASRVKILIDAFDMNKVKPIFDYLTNAVQSANIGQSFSNILGGIKGIINALAPLKKAAQEAFGEIFPWFTGIKTSVIYDFSKKIAKFGKYFSVSADSVDKFKRIFKGLFAAISLGGKILISFKNSLSNAFEKIDGSAILEIFAKIGDFLVQLNENYDIDHPFSILNDIFAKLKDTIQGLLNLIPAWIKDFKLFSKSTEETGVAVKKTTSILDIFKQKLTEIGNKLTYYKDKVVAFLSPILGPIVAKIKEFAKVIGTALKPVIDSVMMEIKALSGDDVYGGLMRLFTNSAVVVGSFVLNLLALIKRLKESKATAKNSVKTLLDTFKNFATGFKNFTEQLSALPATLNKAISGSAKSLQKMLDKQGFEAQAKGILYLAAAIGILAVSLLLIASIPEDKIWTATGAVEALVLAVIGFMEGMNAISSANDGVQSFKKSISQLSDALKQSSLATSMIKLAAAVLIMAFAMKVMKDLNWDDVAQGLVVITVIMGEMFGMAVGLDKLNISSFNKIALSFIILSEAIKILADSMVNMQGLNWDDVTQGLLAITVIMAEFFGMAVGLDKLKIGSFNLIATSMILMAKALELLLNAMGVMKDLSWEDIIQGLTVITVLLGEIFIVAYGLKKFGITSFIQTASGLTALATGVSALAHAIKSLGEMDPYNLANGIMAVSLVLAELTLAVIILSKNGKMQQSALGILALGAAMMLIANAFKTLGEMNPENITQAFMALTFTLAGLIIVCYLAQDSITKAGLGLILMAVAMNILTFAIKSLGNADIMQILKGVAGVAAGLLVLVVALKFVEGSLAGAAALLIVSVGLVAFAAALTLLTILPLADLAGTILLVVVALAALAAIATAMTSAIVGAAAMLVIGAALLVLAVAVGIIAAIPFEAACAGLAALGIAIVGFAGLSALLTPLLPVMLGLAAVLAVVSLGIVALGGGVALLGMGLQAMAIYGSVGIASFGMFCEILSKNAKALYSASTTMTVLAAALVLLDAGLIVCAASMVAMSAAMVAFGVASIIFAASLVATVKIIKVAIKDFREIFKKEEFKETGENAVTGLADGVKSGGSKIIESLKEVGKKAIESIKSFFGTGKDSQMGKVGANAVDGFINGIKSKLSSVGSAAKTLGSNFISKLKNSLKEKSPSKATEEIGAYADEGLAIGVKKGTKGVVKAAEDLGDTTVSAMSKALDIVSNAMNSDAQPTITPVLDLSEIQNGVNSMNSLIDRDRATTISANYNANRLSEMEQMAYNQAQLNRFGNQLAGLVSQLQSQEPTPVDVNVTLAGEADGVFKLVEKVNNRYIKMHGKSALA